MTLLALTLVLAVGSAAPKEPPAATVSRLVDGSSLLVVPSPGSGKVSLRWVVHAGASQDPPDKAGLAHVLEHLLFHGTYGISGLSLDQSVRGVGTSRRRRRPGW